MHTNLELEVFRRLDNRSEGQSDESPRALELHNRRKRALHAAFDTDPVIRVVNWGETDDTKPHELVKVVVEALIEAVAAEAVKAAFKYAIVPGIKWLGIKLAKKGISSPLGESVKHIVAKLRPKQEAKELLDFTIILPDKTEIKVDPPDRFATITITFSDKSVQSLDYLKSSEEGVG